MVTSAVYNHCALLLLHDSAAPMDDGDRKLAEVGFVIARVIFLKTKDNRVGHRILNGETVFPIFLIMGIFL